MAIAHLPALNLSHPIESLVLPSQLQVNGGQYAPATDVKDSEGVRIGAIRKRTWDGTWKDLWSYPTYDLFDEQEHILATGVIPAYHAYGGSLSFHVKFTDSEGIKIGTIKQVTHWFSSSGKVRDARGKKIAITETDFSGALITIRHPKNSEKIYATMKKTLLSWFTRSVSWELTIHDPTMFRKHSFDPRLLLMFPAIEIDLANIARRNADD